METTKLSDAEKKKIEDKVNQAKVKIVLKYPFFAAMICKHKFIYTEQVPTAGVSESGTVFINRAFCKGLSTDQLVFLLCHEAMHIVFAHRIRKYGRNHMLWNVAGDAVINHMLKVAGIGAAIEGTVEFDWVTDNMTSEEVYERLKKKGGHSGDGEDDGDEEDSGDGETGTRTDGEGGIEVTIRDLIDEVPNEPNRQNNPSDSEVGEALQKGRLEMSEAHQAEKMRGAGGGALGALIEAMLAVKVPWYELLERYMHAKKSNQVSWNRPNRRYARFAYLPGTTHVASMGRVVVGIDTSGSIGDREMSEFLAHLCRICEDCRPESVDVLYTTGQVEEHEHFELSDFPIPPRHNRWCGGTDMCAVTNWVENECDEIPDVTIIFTDGYTPVPEQFSGDLVWVLTEDYEPEGLIGTVLHL